ncbi:hypothetical protein HPP92_015430 [Vanilla planifolia]|uniref:PAP/OAS1 substrate-binding-related domain-containing protein n=1 Tax=Vanilla planifolia TaxID=51239 RepID=A0A835UTP0_VANPL|nr:hypothetical protein HPP92_015430 [Vanilla planifolia]
MHPCISIWVCSSKTYLPDGDIDLTAIGIPSSEEALASDVRLVLEREEHNKDAEFEVKDVQYIHAEVKLVKCLVQNIVVDISFNQIGGLGTLCFLEQVDRIIGKDHLFKRSVILIKAWCYYESRILGAHHGLISTYALEILILKFDWDNYCISLHGPVSLSSLPELSVEKVEDESGDRLPTEEFLLRNCIETFSIPLRASESNCRTFTKKHLNIVDPLRENNNLGRSVSKGNFYRIRSAFTYGAKKLGRLLLLPAGTILGELDTFFMDTMDRHGGRQRSETSDFVPRLVLNTTVESNGVNLVTQVEKSEKMKADKLSSESASGNAHRDLKHSLMKAERSLFHEHQMSTGDANDLATARTIKASTTKEDGILDSKKPFHAPHLFFLPKNQTRREKKAVPICSNSLDSCRDVYSNSSSTTDEKVINSMHPDSIETNSSTSSACSTRCCGNSSFEDDAQEGNESNGSSCLSNELADLSGEEEMHMNSLWYAQWCQQQVLSSCFLPIQRSPTNRYLHGRDPWTHGNTSTAMNSNAISPRPTFSSTSYYSANLLFISEDVAKPRGTGTYFPNTNYHLYRERHSPGRLKNNGRMDASMEKGSQEQAVQATTYPSASKAPPNCNGRIHPPECSKLEFGSLGSFSVGSPVTEHGRKRYIHFL